MNRAELPAELRGLHALSGHAPRLSIVIPARDEAGSLPALVDEIAACLEGQDFEMIVVDDGSTDATPALLEGLCTSGRPWLRPLRHEMSCGQSAAIRTGLLAARGRIVVTIDGDGQNNPGYILPLVAMLEAAPPGVGMVTGRRTGRVASRAKRLASRVANRVRGGVLGDGAIDSACGLKALRRDLFLKLPFFTSWHRFMPALVVREGLAVHYLDIVDRPRRTGQSKYGIWTRGLRGIVDLLGVWWLMRRSGRRPQTTELRPHDS